MRNLKKSAQSLIEYGLILALVAVVAITVLKKFGNTMTNVGTQTNSTVNTASEQAAKNACEGTTNTAGTTSTGKKWTATTYDGDGLILKAGSCT